MNSEVERALISSEAIILFHLIVDQLADHAKSQSTY